MNGDEPGSDLQECGTGSGYGSGSEETAALLSRPSVTPLVVAPQAVVVLGGASSSSSGSINSGPTQHQLLTSQSQQNNAGCSSQMSTSGKPVLQRQDRATFLVASPQLSVSGLGGSEESGTGIDDPATRSVPDIELQCRMDDQPHTILPSSGFSSSHYRPRHSHVHRCRCERRDSLAPMSALHLARSISRESVRSGGLQHCCPCQVGGSGIGGGGSGLYSSIYAGGSGGTLPPPLLVTTSPTTRMIRQSSQPEAHPGSSTGGGGCCCCSGCSCPIQHGIGGVAGGSSATPSAASLRQLREPGDGIAGIAADSLRINGGIRQFRQHPWWWCKSATTPPPPSSSSFQQQQQQQYQQQHQQQGGSVSGSSGGGGSQSGGPGVVLCPRTLAQVRRSKLRRALTEATADTVSYVKAVGPYTASASIVS